MVLRFIAFFSGLRNLHGVKERAKSIVEYHHIGTALARMCDSKANRYGS